MEPFLSERPPSNGPGFGELSQQPPDALLSLIGFHRADPRHDKIDLGVGVYRDETGATPIMRSVKAAERRLWLEQDTKSYLGAEGDVEFTSSLAPIVLGSGLAYSDRLTSVQTPGGTGALRLGAEVIARAHPDVTIWLGTPTWPNHRPIFQEAGLATRMYGYFDATAGEIDFSSMMESLQATRAGDVLLLHGCCHNPTGTGFDADQWGIIIELLVQRGLIPFVDLAYQGLGDGLDADAAGVRRMLAAAPSGFVAYSCNKNFGLYRERVGALFAQAPGAGEASLLRQNMLVLARSLWSMPPDHGAAVARLVLADAALFDDWRAELEAMRCRINGLRTALAAAHPRLRAIERQRGMFAMLPLSPGDVSALRENNALYIAPDGRINIAGLRLETIDRLADAVRPLLERDNI